MRHRSLKLGLAATTVLATVLPLALFAGPAFADYAPAQKDVVGVGSDTLQYMLDYLADGSATGDPGYNSGGNHWKLVSIDATADANARLAYGVNGGQASQTACTPGTGSTVGSANASGTNSGTPCVLNPSVVLRAGTQAVQRPNGSGAGFKALVQDIVAGNNGGTGAGTHNEVINFSRASSTQSTTATLPAGQYIDQLSIASDPLPMVKASTSNAVPLSAAQLSIIYSANTGSCVTWNDPRIGGSSPDAIIPLLPQVGSGTRSYFLGALSPAVTTVGTCVQVSEENDPTAIGQTTTPADAIEPISLGRLNLFLGGNFLDPSCAYLSGAAACGTGTVSTRTWVTNTVNPAVTAITSGTPGGTVGGALFNPTRTLYLYFRNGDLTSTQAWQPGTAANWVESLLYDPCQSGQSGCTGSSGPSAGPYGTPYIQSTSGQTDLSDAGVTPLVGSAEVCVDITSGGPAC